MLFGYRKKPKQVISDWANDTVGNNTRTIEIIDQLLPYTKKITDFWILDPAYIESKKDITLYKMNLYIHENMEQFLSFYQSTSYQQLLQEHHEKEPDFIKAELEVLKISLSKFDINLSDIELQKFYQVLNQYQKLLFINQNIKRTIIIANYLIIFNNCAIINEIKRKNSVYAKTIGSYEQIEEILGENGIKIQSGNNAAVTYVMEIEDYQETLENKKSVCTLDNEYRR